MKKVNRKKNAISTFIATLILMILAVSAGVVIYTYTMGYLGNVNMKPNEGGVLQVQSIAQFDGELHIYAKNIGKGTVNIDPADGLARVYVNDVDVRDWDPPLTYSPNPDEVLEGVTSDIVITGFTIDDVGKTSTIKIVTADGTFALTNVKITEDAVGGSGGNFDPSADFTFTTTGLTADFTDASTDSDGTIVSWLWDFGDAQTSTAQNPSHPYASANTYTVRLTVTDNDGATDYVEKGVTVSLANVPPTAEFSFDPSDPETGEDVVFTDLSDDTDGTIVAWLWNFGDGVGTSTLQSPTYAYSGDGVYTVRLTVTDDDSATHYVEHNVPVSIPNQTPVLGLIGPKGGNELTLISFTATATDADLPPQTLTFSLTGTVPSGASITSGGDFTWTPAEDQDGDHSITVRVTDDGSPNLYNEETITVTVSEVNLAPTVMAIDDVASHDEMTLLSFTATATDPDLPANTWTFSLVGETYGASIASGGLFSWTPTEAQGPGDYSFTVRATDNGSPALYDDEVFSVHVNEVSATWTLTINKLGTGTVYVDSVPYTAPVAVPQGNTVSLSETPGVGKVFGGWYYDTTSAFTTPILVTMDSDKTVTAVFGTRSDIFTDSFRYSTWPSEWTGFSGEYTRDYDYDNSHRSVGVVGRDGSYNRGDGAITATVITTGYYYIQVNYDRYAYNLEINDHYYIDWRIGAGTWNNIEDYRTASWANRQETLQGAHNTASIQIRFSLDNGDTDQNYGYVDSLSVTGIIPS